MEQVQELLVQINVKLENIVPQEVQVVQTVQLVTLVVKVPEVVQNVL